MYGYNCSSETLMVAEEEVNYLKFINVKEAEIKFKSQFEFINTQ